MRKKKIWPYNIKTKKSLTDVKNSVKIALL